MTSLGSIEISVRGKPVTEDKWIRKKSKLILVYLMLNPGIKFTKDKMMDMFFQELSVESAENIFHQAVTNIRNAVKPYDINTICVPVQNEKAKSSKIKSLSIKEKKAGDIKAIEPSFIIYEDKILRLSPDYYYNVDVIEFNKFYSKVKSSESDEETKEISAKKALELYKGDFLPGYYDPWCEDLRENLTNKYIDLCSILIDIYKKKNSSFEVTIYAEKLIEADKLNENIYIDLIESYVNIGNINTAKNKFAQMLKIFDEEYGEKPSSKTLEKIKNILMQD
jgi:two-component SAPR family response regulator